MNIKLKSQATDCPDLCKCTACYACLQTGISQIQRHLQPAIRPE